MLYLMPMVALDGFLEENRVSEWSSFVAIFITVLLRLYLAMLTEAWVSFPIVD